MPQLIPHPRSQEYCAGVTVEARVRSRENAVLELTYTVNGPMDRLVVSSVSPPRFTSGLWEHTCFELFVSTAGALAYHEYNFAPWGSWALFGFEDYRSGGPIDAADHAPRITQVPSDDALIVDVTVDLGSLARAYTQSPLSVGLTAVVEHRDSALSYWALAHGAGEPDFHDRDGFVLCV